MVSLLVLKPFLQLYLKGCGIPCFTHVHKKITVFDEELLKKNCIAYFPGLPECRHFLWSLEFFRMITRETLISRPVKVIWHFARPIVTARARARLGL